MERDEHLQWCKDRAMEYVTQGDLVNAIASMLSDLEKHDGTSIKGKPALQMLQGLALQQAAQGDRAGVERFIQGFN